MASAFDDCADDPAMREPSDGTADRRWKALAGAMGVALAALVAQTVVGFGAVATETVGRFADDLVVMLATVLCLLRTIREPRGRRTPWLMLTGALASWSFGTAYQSLFHRPQPSAGATISDLV